MKDAGAAMKAYLERCELAEIFELTDLRWGDSQREKIANVFRVSQEEVFRVASALRP